MICDQNIFHSNKHLVRRFEMHAGLHVKCSLVLSEFNQNWDVSTIFNKTPHYQISWKSAQQFLSCYMQTELAFCNFLLLTL
jgi:hypothetical protein